MTYSVYITSEKDAFDAILDPMKCIITFHDVGELEKDMLIDLCSRHNYGILFSPYGGRDEDNA